MHFGVHKTMMFFIASFFLSFTNMHTDFQFCHCVPLSPIVLPPASPYSALTTSVWHQAQGAIAQLLSSPMSTWVQPLSYQICLSVKEAINWLMSKYQELDCKYQGQQSFSSPVTFGIVTLVITNKWYLSDLGLQGSCWVLLYRPFSQWKILFLYPGLSSVRLPN